MQGTSHTTTVSVFRLLPKHFYLVMPHTWDRLLWTTYNWVVQKIWFILTTPKIWCHCWLCAESIFCIPSTHWNHFLNKLEDVFSCNDLLLVRVTPKHASQRLFAGQCIARQSGLAQIVYGSHVEYVWSNCIVLREREQNLTCAGKRGPSDFVICIIFWCVNLRNDAQPERRVTAFVFLRGFQWANSSPSCLLSEILMHVCGDKHRGTLPPLRFASGRVHDL